MFQWVTVLGVPYACMCIHTYVCAYKHLYVLLRSCVVWVGQVECKCQCMPTAGRAAVGWQMASQLCRWHSVIASTSGTPDTLSPVHAHRYIHIRCGQEVPHPPTPPFVSNPIPIPPLTSPPLPSLLSSPHYSPPLPCLALSSPPLSFPPFTSPPRPRDCHHAPPAGGGPAAQQCSPAGDGALS